MVGCYTISAKTRAAACAAMCNGTTQKLWNSFCLTFGALELEACEGFVFRIGTTPLPRLDNGREYALLVDQNGAALVGRDYGGLMRGFMSLLMKIEYKNKTLFIKPACEQSEYRIATRMIHICVFPENDLNFIRKLVRLAALCQYTHVVIEFWGMLQFDCLSELAWPHAFTKAEAKSLTDECRELGIAPVPMFNMFGHASASRVRYGKHVVLDQNPALQHLFTPDGWAWDITCEDVPRLFSQVRRELYDLFGDCEYFHIGFDEAYFYMHNDELRAHVPAFLKQLTHDIAAEGYKPMMWMDMILEKGDYPKEYYAFGNPGEARQLLDSLAKETVMVDWQYNITEPPLLTSLYLKDKGHELIVAPWLKRPNYTACINTVADNNLSGLMLTTWHTLQDQMYSILGCAQTIGAKTFVWSVNRVEEETATMLRRVSFEGNSYADCGWSKQQIQM